MNERRELMKKIATYDFAIVDLKLFLDTHPNDTVTSQKLDEYIAKSDALRAEYEEKYGPIQSTAMETNRWAWICNPWPWDNKEE